ncbi:hypothetical protein Tco_0017566 [Tanacetum coccineum]
MVWRGTSLRYETGEKKVNEVDFISQGVELDGGNVVKLVDLLVDCMMVVKEVENELFEEVERSWNGGLSKTFDDEGGEDEENGGGDEV